MGAETEGPPLTGWAKLVPELIVADLDTSLAFWRDLLGFRIAYQRAQPRFVYLERPEGVQIMLCERHGQWETGPLQRPFGRGVMFQAYLENIKPVLAVLEKAGWPLHLGPREVWRQVGAHEQGQREAFVQDPDGYLVMIAHELGLRAPHEDTNRAIGDLGAEVTFQVVREAESSILLEMVRAYHTESGPPLTSQAQEAVIRIAKGEPLARAWLMREGGRVAGYVVVTLGYSIEYEGCDGFIDELYLTPEARGRGLGRKLLDFTLLQATQLGIKTLHLEAEHANNRATRLYETAGFGHTGRKLMRLRLGAGTELTS